MNDPILPPAPRVPTGRDVDRALSPGWAAKFFGGGDPFQQGLFQPGEVQGMGRQALFNAGVNILANSGPAPYRRGLGEILAGGIQAGQQSYQAGAQHALGMQGILGQRQAQQRLAQIRQRYAGRNDPDSMRGMMNELIGEGTPEALAGARALSEYLKSMQDSSPRLIRSEEMVDGKRKVVFRDARSGQIITQGDDQPPVTSTSGLSIPPSQFSRTLYDPFVVKSINTYHQLMSHLHEARAGKPAAYKSAVSAFIANAEPNNQLRLGMLQYLQEVDPSVQGRADIALQKLKDGTWPDSILDGMQSVAEHNYRQVRERTQAIYDDYMANNPGVYITPPNVRFGDAQTETPQGTAGRSGFQFRRP